jgi:hypothetical protein
MAFRTIGYFSCLTPVIVLSLALVLARHDYHAIFPPSEWNGRCTDGAVDDIDWVRGFPEFCVYVTGYGHSGWIDAHLAFSPSQPGQELAGLLEQFAGIAQELLF